MLQTGLRLHSGHWGQQPALQCMQEASSSLHLERDKCHTDLCLLGSGIGEQDQEQLLPQPH